MIINSHDANLPMVGVFFHSPGFQISFPSPEARLPLPSCSRLFLDAITVHLHFSFPLHPRPQTSQTMDRGSDKSFSSAGIGSSDQRHGLSMSPVSCVWQRCCCVTGSTHAFCPTIWEGWALQHDLMVRIVCCGGPPTQHDWMSGNQGQSVVCG